MRHALLVAALFSTGIAAAAPPRSALNEGQRDTPDVLLSRGRQSYERQDYDGAIRAIEPLIYPTVQLGSDAEPVARKLLAIAYLMELSVPKAEAEFQTLLQIDSNFRLNQLLDPPRAYAFFEDLRRKNQEKLAEIAEQQRREQVARELEAERKRKEEEERIRLSLKPVVIERTVEKHAFLLNFVPFGAGQFQNGDWKKGALMLTTQLALGAASLVLWGAMLFEEAAYAGRPLTPATHSAYLAASQLQIASFALGVAFWLDVAVGIIDALRGYKAEVVSERKVVDHAPAKTVSVAPFIAPAAGGLSIQGAF